MRLLTKITVLFLTLSGFVFFIGGFISFEVIKAEIDYEQQNFLLERLEGIESMIKRRNLSEPFRRDKLAIIPLDSGEETNVVYSDTLVTHATLDRLEPHVKLDVVKLINGKLYKISTYDLIVEEDDIADGVEESLLKIYALLFGVVIILTVLISRMLLRPFNITLKEIKNFNISQKQPIALPKTGTREFKKLNQYVGDMTEKIRRDYRSLKEFSENASHEMQTPISIAKGKIELLMSSDGLAEKEINLLTQVDTSLQKLSSLVGSLSLLTKMENAEFTAVQQINLSKHIKDNLSYFSELIELKGIQLEADIEENISISIDPNLLDILISNLLKNAIRHNIDGGYISVNLKNKIFTIENSGPTLGFQPDQMFERFKKGDQSSDSLGLGLSLVKKVADLNGLALSYSTEDTKHQFVVRFI